MEDLEEARAVPGGVPEAQAGPGGVPDAAQGRALADSEEASGADPAALAAAPCRLRRPLPTGGGTSEEAAVSAALAVRFPLWW